MNNSKTEELLAILWFLLATYVHGWRRTVCVVFGTIALVGSFLLAFFPV